VAILVLVLWLFTAGAGFSVLISSNLKRDRPVSAASPVPTSPEPAVSPMAAASAISTASAVSGVSPASAASRSAFAAEVKRARREQFDPTALVAAREAPIIPGARALLEFSHPACGIVGLAFWLAFSLVHARVFGWIGFGLAAVTACAGLTWFAINLRAARRAQSQEAQDVTAPSFRGRLVALHGAAAALTLVLAALSAVVLHG
jgi:hypothetical protein